MWGKRFDADNIDSKIWRRTAANAERFWSAQNVRDVNDMYRRLEPGQLKADEFSIVAQNGK